jgi:hypothetical protein
MKTVRTARPGLLRLDSGQTLFKSEYNHDPPRDGDPMVFNMAGEFVVGWYMDLPCRELDDPGKERTHGVSSASRPPGWGSAAEALVPIVRSVLVAAFTQRGEAEQVARARGIVMAITNLIDERIESGDS